jgi:hypothetical protein
MVTINRGPTMKRSLLTLGLSMALSVFAFGAASGQTPTEAERQALRANCAADYRSNCSSIPPGRYGLSGVS